MKDIKVMLLGIVLILMGLHVMVLGNDYYGNIICLFGYIVVAVGLFWKVLQLEGNRVVNHCWRAYV